MKSEKVFNVIRATEVGSGVHNYLYFVYVVIYENLFIMIMNCIQIRKCSQLH
jgi:hypothetical protein